jgi:hypothetical protein
MECTRNTRARARNDENNDPIFPKKADSRVVYIIIMYKNVCMYVYLYTLLLL